MAVKKILLQKQIEGTIYDIFTKTDATIVQYVKGETVTTVAAELAAIATALESIDTADEVDAKIKELRDDIYGLAEGESLAEAFDTLKEISAYLDAHGDVVQGFTNDISALKTALGTAKTDDAEATGLFATVDAIDARVQALENAATDVVDGDTDGTIKVDGEVITVYAGTPGLIQQDATHRFVSDEQTAAWDAKVGTVTDETEGDGKIEVDGEEMVVYTHPETHAATMIVEDETHRFVTDVENAAWDAKAEVEYVTELPDEVSATTLYMVSLD